MATRASLQIHLFTNGDVVLDELINALDNPDSPVAVFKQAFPPGVATAVHNPFYQLIGGPTYLVTNVLIVPDPLNTQNWSLTTEPTTTPTLLLHKTNPMLLSLVSLEAPLYIFHYNPTAAVFQFFWT